jgi:hypothetical protein
MTPEESRLAEIWGVDWVKAKREHRSTPWGEQEYRDSLERSNARQDREKSAWRSAQQQRDAEEREALRASQEQAEVARVKAEYFAEREAREASERAQRIRDQNAAAWDAEYDRGRA